MDGAHDITLNYLEKLRNFLNDTKTEHSEQQVNVNGFLLATHELNSIDTAIEIVLRHKEFAFRYGNKIMGEVSDNG